MEQKQENALNVMIILQNIIVERNQFIYLFNLQNFKFIKIEKGNIEQLVNLYKKILINELKIEKKKI